MADALHQGRVGAGSQVVDHRVAGNAVLAGDLHLDQFVLLERQVHLGHQRVGHALRASLQDRPEVVRLATQEAGLGGGQGVGMGFLGR